MSNIFSKSSHARKKPPPSHLRTLLHMRRHEKFEFKQEVIQHPKGRWEALLALRDPAGHHRPTRKKACTDKQAERKITASPAPYFRAS